MGGIMPRRRDDCICHTDDQGVTVTDLAESETAILALREQVTSLTRRLDEQERRQALLLDLMSDLQAVGEAFTGACIELRTAFRSVSSPHGQAG